MIRFDCGRWRAVRTTCVLKEWSYEARRPFAVAGFATRVGVRGIAAAGGKIGSLARVLSASPSKAPRNRVRTRKGEGWRLPDTMICGHFITFSAIGLPVLVEGGYYSKSSNVRSYMATLSKRSKTFAHGRRRGGGGLVHARRVGQLRSSCSPIPYSPRGWLPATGLHTCCQAQRTAKRNRAT